MHDVVPVELPGREYDVVIGDGLLARLADLVAPELARPRLVIVADARVAELHLPRLQAGLRASGIDTASLTVPSGEASKSWAELERVVEWLLEQKVERRDMILAFGGGVIGDLVGFAAAILRRGVRFVQVPTTLLAQVDSSVGGKTGINSPLGKNLIGAFHQPSLVVADTGLLASLPRRDFLAGYGEVVKYGLLGDAQFFGWLETHAPSMLEGDGDAISHAVRRSVEMKAEIVLRDETEQGDRALLNLGHTFGHALEAATGYSDRLLHGEGVAMGCALAFDLSARLGLCSQEEPSRVRAHLAQMGMAWRVSALTGEMPDAAGLLELMRQDKKVQDGKLRLILARAIGAAFVATDTPEAAILEVLEDALKATAPD